VLEGAVPGLNQLVPSIGKLHRPDLMPPAIRKLDQQREQSGAPSLPVAPPVLFEDPAFGRSGTLLQLAGGGVASHGTFEIIDLRLTKTLGPEQLPGLGARVLPADRGHPLGGLIFGR